jgi:predicted nucleotidyltransferase component of viral defense system
MTGEGKSPKDYLEDLRRFREALMWTASQTGFSERLIEKDYYCSTLLTDLKLLFEQGLIFKGGTCLSKVHSKFFRLSEDLDFGLSVNSNASHGHRRRAAEPIKAHLAGIMDRLPFFFEATRLKGAHHNKHYTAQFAYRSVITGENDSIKMEFSLREEMLLPCEELPANTILIDPLTNTAVLSPIAVRALSLREAYSEKTRAALTRPEPAIRDFFDIDNAVRNGLLDHSAPEFLNLVSRKLALTQDPVNTSTERIEILTRQIETQLKPVLRSADYEQFDLDRVLVILRQVVDGCLK